MKGDKEMKTLKDNIYRLIPMLSFAACVTCVFLIKSALNRQDYFWLALDCILFVINYLLFYYNSRHLK